MTRSLQFVTWRAQTESNGDVLPLSGRRLEKFYERSTFQSIMGLEDFEAPLGDWDGEDDENFL